MLTPARPKIQSGYVLFVLLAIMLSVSTFVALRLLKRDMVSSNTARSADLAILQDIRAQLILSALARDTNPGALPCPDTDNDGATPSCTAAEAMTAARYPYKILPYSASSSASSSPTVPMTDAVGECIWYALAPSLRNSLNPSQRKATSADLQPINPDIVGTLKFNGADVLAVLIAPGPTLPTQARCAAGSSGCPTSICSSATASNYLEKLGNADNAGPGQFADASLPTAWNTATGKCVSKASISNPGDVGLECNNDVVLPLLKSDILKPLMREVLRRLTLASYSDAIPGLQARLTGTTAVTTLDVVRNSDPFGFDSAVFGTMSTKADPADASKQIPDAESNGCYRSAKPGGAYDPRPLWLCSNDWYRFMAYNPSSNTLSVSGNISPSFNYSCSIAPLTAKEIKCH